MLVQAGDAFAFDLQGDYLVDPLRGYVTYSRHHLSYPGRSMGWYNMDKAGAQSSVEVALVRDGTSFPYWSFLVWCCRNRIHKTHNARNIGTTLFREVLVEKKVAVLSS